MTRYKPEGLEGLEMLPHPVDGPTLAPSAYQLFQAMAHSLDGQRRKTVDEVEEGYWAILALNQSGPTTAKDSIKYFEK